MFSKIAIVGSGALGICYGTRLALAGADVRFLMRGDLAAVRARGSLRVHENGGILELRPVAAFATAAEIGPVDLVVVTLKTTANAELAHLIPPLLGPRTPICTLQNGFGADEHLAARFGAERIMGGLAFTSSMRVAPGEVRCLEPGRITLGEFVGAPAERTHALAARFRAAGVNADAVENLPEARWRKLVWNIPFNGLAIARGGITTDRICADPALVAEVRALMDEVRRAAAGFGFTIPEDFIRRQFDVTPPMGAYSPSSLGDFLAGREVELEAIWGEPLRRAEAAGVALPRLAALYAQLRGLTVRAAGG